MMLMFDCHDCRRYLEIEPLYGETYGWEWFHNAAEQAWQAGWYVRLANGSLGFGRIMPPAC